MMHYRTVRFGLRQLRSSAKGLGEERQAVTLPQYCLVTVGVGIQTSNSKKEEGGGDNNQNTDCCGSVGGYRECHIVTHFFNTVSTTMQADRRLSPVN